MFFRDHKFSKKITKEFWCDKNKKQSIALRKKVLFLTKIQFVTKTNLKRI